MNTQKVLIHGRIPQKQLCSLNGCQIQSNIRNKLEREYNRCLQPKIIFSQKTNPQHTDSYNISGVTLAIQDLSPQLIRPMRDSVAYMKDKKKQVKITQVDLETMKS